MIRHGPPYMHPAQAPWREAVTLAPRIADATSHYQNDAHCRRLNRLKRAKGSPPGPHGSHQTSNSASALNGPDPKSP